MIKGLIRHKEKHLAKGNKFGFYVADKNGVSRTISHRYGNDGSESLIEDYSSDVKQKSLRKMTPLEIERLQGFPEGWTSLLSDSRRYKALGNAVTTKVITSIINDLFKGTEYIK